MKKHILTLIGIAIFCNSYSQINPIREQYFHSTSKSESKLKSIIKIVPTDFREILWSTFSNNWDTSLSYSYQLKYIDNKIITKYDLDYTRSDTSFKYEYIYDGQNKLIQIDKYFYNSSDGSYTLFYKDLYYYFNNNLRTLIVYQEYDTNTQLWVTKRRKIEELDVKGNLILSKLEEYGVNGWKVLNYFGKSYTYYNNTNRLILEIDSVYNSNTKKTGANNKTERVYNNLDQLVEFKRYTPNNNLLKLSSIIKIEYNNLGVPLKEVVYDASQFPTLIPSFKIDSITWLSFDSDVEYFNNIQLSSIDSTYQNAAYYFSGKTIGVKLDSNNSYSVSYYWMMNNNLKKFSRNDRIFDSNKSLIESLSYSVDVNDNWEISNADKNIITYDIDNNVSEFIEQRYKQNQYVNFRKREYSNYISIDVSSGINTSKNTLKVKLFPNPSADGKVSVNVKMEAASALSIKITDLKGSVVYTDKKELGKGLNTVELSGLQQGMYVVVLSNEYGVSRTKLIVQ